MRTVVAVTEPFVAAGPKALTQSPTARSVDAAVWVALTVVELAVVTLSVSVLGVVGFLVFDEDLVKAPGLTLMPDTVRVDPLTPVTLPEAMARSAKALRKLEEPPPLKLGRVPPSAPPPPPKPPPVRKPPPPPGNAPGPPAPAAPVRLPRVVHEPDELAVFTVMVRAAIVVLDFFEGAPLTVTQSPLTMALTASVAVLENAVVVVQLTVVCPEVAFWTSMLDALRDATLPVAPVGALAGVAAPAAEAKRVAASSAVAPAPPRRMKRRRLVLRLVNDCIVLLPLFRCHVWCVSSQAQDHSLRRASMGASVAARLAG